MIFSSSVFLFLFLPITIIIYFLLKTSLRNYWLLIVSLLFYSWGEPKQIAILLVIILINYIMTLLMYYISNIGIKRFILFAIVLINCANLFYYKYTVFVLQNISKLLSLQLNIPDIILPIGISFYTFQLLSYGIDVYKGKIKPQKNIGNFALYVSFFPKLIDGPIVRYADIESQVACRTITVESFYNGIRRFMIGLSKKVLIADRTSIIADAAFASQEQGLFLWIGAIAYTIQIYFDFSGYSDMAIGLGKMFGFEFLENFNYPYIATSVKDFWRRWHISLSSWFRDYIYIPLGGNRKGIVRTYTNIFIVFLLTGIWHGANWNFVLWGIYYAIWQIIEGVCRSKINVKMSSKLKHIYCMLVVIIGWVIFRADDMTKAIQYLYGMLRIDRTTLYGILYNISLENLFYMVVGCVLAYPVCNLEIIKRCPSVIKNIGLFIVYIIALMYVVGSGFSPFLYFRF